MVSILKTQKILYVRIGVNMSVRMTEEQVDDLLDYIDTSNPNFWKDGEKLVCCPVHGESNPSMGISIEKQVCHCFSCHFAGDFARLLAYSKPEEFGLKYSADGKVNKASAFRAERKAREFLALRYELEYHEIGRKTRNVKRYEQTHNVYLKEDEKRVELPRFKLAPFKSGKETYGYFFDRDFTKEEMKKFMIGRDLDNQTITIPVFYEDGVLAGVIGRYISKNRKKNQRYKIYDDFERSKLLYPLDKSKPIKGVALIVEGQLDAIRMHRAGHTNTYAIMTNDMSKRQAEWLCANCDCVIWIGDNDDRGLEGREKARVLLKNKIDFKIVDYPDHGKDVCDWSDEEIEEMLSTARGVNIRKLKRLS